jgi:Tfp pilus assembly protein PilN
LLLAVSLTLAAWLTERYRDARVEVARLETQSGLIAPERPAKPIPREKIEEEARNAEAVVRQLTLPWAALIGTIEQAATREVAILQLQPDADTRLLRLTAETRQRDAMFDFVRRLAASPGLADVHLVSHQVQREDPQQPVQFSIQASIREIR